MEQEDYCSYELALKLKACGFDKPCIAEWACEPDGKPILLGSTAFVFSNAELKGRDVTAPLLYQAQKWLREKKKLLVYIVPVCYCYEDREWVKEEPIKWCFIINNSHSIAIDRQGRYTTYEQALSAGISAALELNEQENK